MILLEICSIRHLLFKEVELKLFSIKNLNENWIILKTEIEVELKLF